jgi:NAD-dependent dihydropyrimidine dehydrogenase PreA subunit
MWVISIDSDKCQGEGNCGEICPVAVLGIAKVNSKKTTVIQDHADDCLINVSCVTICEHDAITVVDM